jgi:hypothetical protein
VDNVCVRLVLVDAVVVPDVVSDDITVDDADVVGVMVMVTVADEEDDIDDVAPDGDVSAGSIFDLLLSFLSITEQGICGIQQGCLYVVQGRSLLVVV